MNDLKHYYLQHMGIEPWVLREKNTPALPAACNLDTLAATVSTCTLCPLHKTRTQTVFSKGNPSANLMIIGEAPGIYEDKEGLPFVGKAGKLLDKMLKSINLSEDDAYIANVLKCRPPNNRDPQTEEVSLCSSYLKQQIELIQPKLILALGRFAGQFLLNQPLTLAKMRDHLHEHQSIPVIVTYHPAYLLRNPKDKKKAYLDLLRAQSYLLNNAS